MTFLTIASFVFFTGLVAFLTWRITRGHGISQSSTGYFLAGRALTGGYIAGSLMLTNLSTEQLVGLNGAAFKDGLCVMAWEVIAALSLVLMALWFLPRYLKSGIATIPQLLESRYDDGTRLITTVIFVVAYAAILLPIILYTGATGLVGVLDLSKLTGIEDRSTLLWLATWFIGILGSIYAIFGGLRSVAVSDTLNGFGLLVGGVMIAVYGLAEVGDGDVLAALGTLREAHPEKFNSLGSPTSSVPFGTLFTGVLLLNLFYWTTNQQIIQRTFGASSLAEGQKGVLLAGFLKVLAPLILVLPGIIAFHLYAEQGIASDTAYGRLVADVLPKPLVGFFAAVLVGAILSSFNSALQSTATLFSLGIYQRVTRTDDEQRVIRSGKICGAVAALAAMSTAPLLAGQDSIFDYLQKMNGIYFIPIFSVVLIGLTTTRVPAAPAKLVLLAGPVLIGLGYFAFPDAAGLPFGLHEFHFLGVVFASLCLLMLGWGRAAPRPTPWHHEATGEVDLTPWRLARPVGLGLCALVLMIYAAFADLGVV
jgi:SSS family solute:Na+ symporter